jgi:hypothetical protein
VDPRAGLDAVERKKILHCQASNPGHPARRPSLYLLSCWFIKSLTSLAICFSVILCVFWRAVVV